MGGGSDTPKNTTSTQKLDPFIKEQVRGNLDYVNQLIDKGFQGYNGQGVVGLNPTVQQGIEGLAGMAQNNPYGGVLQDAVTQVQQAGQYQPQQVNSTADTRAQYANPYENQVVQQAMSDVDRARQMAVNQTQDQAISAGAFGGNRSALAEAETNRGFADRAASIAGQLRQQGFNTALQTDIATQQANQQAGLDQNRLGLLSGQTMGQLGQAGNAMQSGNFMNAINAGQIAQGNQQAQEDFNYQQYLREFEYPLQLAQLRTAAIGGSPAGSSTTTTAPGGGTNRLAGGMGGALSGAYMGSQIMPGWGTAIGAGVGLLGGMFG